MTPLAVSLVLRAAVFHSAWNLVLKSEPRRLEASLIALGAAVLLSAPVLLIHPPTALTARAWALVLLSAAFETAYLITLTALSLAPVSYVVAGREVSIVVTALAGALILTSGIRAAAWPAPP